MLNLTPHAITIKTPNGSTTFQPSGTVARVNTIEKVVGTCTVTGVEVIVRTLGEVVGIPTDGQSVIVSSMVLDACKGMKNVFAPDTGATAIRNEKGHVIAVTRLVTNS